MKRNRKTALSLGLVAALAAAAATTSPVYAGGDHGPQAGQFGQDGMMGGYGAHKGQSGMMGGQGDMMQMMMQMHGQMNGGQGGMMSGHGGAGMMGGGQMGGFGYMLDLDANGDRIVTPAEALAGLQAMLEEFDTDGDGTLSISEFEALHSATIREKMVDRFQMLDNDGDGQITTDEITAPADCMENMMKFHSGTRGTSGGMGAGTHDSTMMQNQSN